MNNQSITMQNNLEPLSSQIAGTIVTDFNAGNDYINSIAIQSDGKILAAGYASGASIVRYHNNGSLDNSFDYNGKLTTPFKEGYHEYYTNVTQLANGSIFAYGKLFIPFAGDQLIFAQYKTNGILDDSLNTNGKFILFNKYESYIKGILLQPDGKILLSRGSEIERRNLDGSLDSIFQSNVNASIGIYAINFALQSDAKILVGGCTYENVSENFAIARYHENGTLDTSFGVNGKVTTDFYGKNDCITIIAIQPDKKILVSGHSDDKFALARYTINGALDSSFGINGQMTWEFGTCVAVQADGKFLIAGTSIVNESNDFTVQRFTANGFPDPTFGKNGSGLVTTDFNGGNDSVTNITIQSDGRILVAGGTLKNGTSDFALARYMPDGSLDTSFNGNDNDVVAPTVITFNPTVGAADVNVSSNIELTFSEPIKKGVGNILIYLNSVNGTVVESFDVATSTKVTLSDAKLTIDPTTNLLGGNHYYVSFDQGVIKDLSDNSYAGNNTYDFTTINTLIPGRTINGTIGNDILSGTAGPDTFYASTGTDIVVFKGNRTDYTLEKIGSVGVRSGLIVTSTAEGTDALYEVERLKFSDKAIALDISGNGGMAYRIYQAAFDRKPDLYGLGYWMSVLDGGNSLKSVAEGFVKSEEFKNSYGTNPSNSELVIKFYNNVLHRAPEKLGYDVWLNVLNTKQQTIAQVLAGFSESIENQNQLIGTIQNGFEYLPFN